MLFILQSIIYPHGVYVNTLFKKIDAHSIYGLHLCFLLTNSLAHVIIALSNIRSVQMNISTFLKLAEIQTKVASMIPFLIGSSYAYYHYGTFNALNFILMLISLLCFDMAVTVLNNYYDFVKAHKREGYGFEKHNAIVKYGIKASTVRKTLAALITIALSAGLALYLLTHPLVLVIGAASFFVGIIYSFGPVPISRTPLGEIFSGFFMGFFIPFLAVFVHTHQLDPLVFSFSRSSLSIKADLDFLIRILILAWPLVAGIGNIMLANNLCDMEEDIENKRYTLPIYIGREKGLQLFEGIYYSSYLAILLGIFSKTIPLYAIICLFTFFPVRKNIRIFKNVQTKKDTFSVSIKNFLTVNFSLLIVLGLSAVLRALGI